jgi:hypothetical protein
VSSRAFLLALAIPLAIHACAPAPRVVPPPQTPQLTPTATAQRVVLLSFDGLGADALAAHTDLPNFAQLASDGAIARIVPVNPTATASAHVAILTGAPPQKNGIVANRFHVAGTPPDAVAEGLTTDIDVETLVEAARRQGKRVGAVLFPTVDARTARRAADFGFAWARPLSKGRIVHLTRDDFHREWVPPTWTTTASRHPSFSPVMRARLDWNAPQHVSADIDLVAYDSTDDRIENYDTFFVESREQEQKPDPRGWFAIAQRSADGTYGSWSKLLATDGALHDVALYWGAIARNDAYPDSYRAMLDEEIGFWPGAPDEHAGLDATTLIEQMERLGTFLTRAQTLTIERMQFDLLLAYQPQIDAASHQFLGTAEGDHALGTVFAMSDGAISAIRAKLDPARDALVVIGDHGLMHIDTLVHMNAWLHEKGFDSWRAFATGDVAELYGDERHDELVKALTDSGFFEQVTVKDASMHRNSGDVVAITNPNVTVDEGRDTPSVGVPHGNGNHGALNTHPELHTVLLAAGAGVPHGSFGTIAQTKIARFVSTLLGIQPPAAAE